jgi:glycosyltransferase involved in cell wall biosynthesis
MKPLKIAFCKSCFAGPVSGADEIMLNYAVQLHKAGQEVSVVLLYPPVPDDPYQRRLQLEGVPVTAVVARSYIFRFLRAVRNVFSSVLFLLFLLEHAPQRFRKLWQIVLDLTSRLHYRECRTHFTENRPDLMHVFTPDTGAALMIRAGHELRIPVLYHEMGTPHHMPMLTDYYRRLEKVLPLCTEVAALSPRLASDWQVRFPFLPSVSVLPLIVEQTKMFKLGLQPQYDDRRVVFGFAARLEEGKGPMVLIDALASVNREAPSAITRIAGTGPQSLEVKARVRELALSNVCEFFGRYSDPLGRTAFMNSLDVLVLPSLAEGTPNTIIEAMSQGVPVIATTVGGIPDILDAESGILIPPANATALADAMLFLARDPARRARMGAAAKHRYEKLFSADVVVPLLLDVYGRVLGNGHAPRTNITSNGKLHPWSKLKLNDRQALGATAGA